MSLLSAHLEQISISCQGIDSLPCVTPYPSLRGLSAESVSNLVSDRFPGPKVFTNSLLSNHDITSLIRDTEAHERALFSVPPPQPPAISPNPDLHQPPARRQTVFNVAAGEVTTGPPKNSTRGGPRRNAAVAAVLGGDLHSQIIRRGGEGAKGDVDIEVLLKGAEKLCSVYPLHGALDRISAQRQKYAQQGNTLAYYESKVGEQQETLESMNRDPWMEEDADEGDADEGDANEGVTKSGIGLMTEEDLRREEEEVRELDRKKKELQERLHAMEKDLGGLLDL